MATVEQGRLTAAEFLQWAARPENQAKKWELEKGVPLEMPPPSEVHGILCSWIAHLLWEYVLRTRRGKGRVSTNDTGLVVEREPDTVRGPDVMLFADSLRVEALSRAYPAVLPLLVVEVKSPSDTYAHMTRRALQYLESGVPLVWLLDPESQTVSAHQLDEFPRLLEGADEISFEKALPGFRCSVSDLFNLPAPEAS